MKRLLSLLLTLWAAMCSYAYDFEDDGIYYTITDEAKKTVEVSNNGSYSQSYSGDVDIPPQ